MISDEIVDEVVVDGQVLGGTEEMTSAVLCGEKVTMGERQGQI